jgi:predicted cation transporter
MVSAVLDNATLAAAEIAPQLNIMQIKSALIALLISGGMLIPGNIPNIVAAGRLRIGSKEWARIGVPVGLVLMSMYFLILMLEGF